MDINISRDMSLASLILYIFSIWGTVAKVVKTPAVIPIISGFIASLYLIR
jgi:hypothetical protein